MEYNEERPHEALGYSVPAARYQPSARRFPETLPAVAYDTDYEPRKVNSDGKISVRRDYYRVGKSLAGQYVGLRKTTVDGTYVVYYCHHKIREITLKKEGSL